MEFGGPRKRGRQHEGHALNGNGGFKKSRSESESFPMGVGSKSKPCTKFFSTLGCPFGEGCHFLHYVPGGYKAVSQMMNPGNSAGPPPYSEASSATGGKLRMCSKFNTSEGCRFGDKCHFAHAEWELGARPSSVSYEDPRGMMGPMSGRMGGLGRMEPPPQPGFGGGAADNFGASATAKISVDGSLAGAIIGKGGANSKQICRVTGVRLAIRDHESDTSLKNIELEGTFDQIKQASSMVREIIGEVKAGLRPPPKYHGHGSGGGGGANLKTKLCENFTKGLCTFGDKCNFAHGAQELIRKTQREK